MSCSRLLSTYGAAYLMCPLFWEWNCCANLWIAIRPKSQIFINLSFLSSILIIILYGLRSLWTIWYLCKYWTHSSISMNNWLEITVARSKAVQLLTKGMWNLDKSGHKILLQILRIQNSGKTKIGYKKVFFSRLNILNHFSQSEANILNI